MILNNSLGEFVHIKKVWKGGRRKPGPVEKDFGPPEQQYRRIIMAGGTPRAAAMSGVGRFARVTRWVDAGDETETEKGAAGLRAPELTTCPLDVLRTRGEISLEQHNAAINFAGVRKHVFGKASPGAIDLLAVIGAAGDIVEDPKEAKKREAAYRRACEMLLSRGTLVFKITEGIIIHHEWPKWISIPNSKHHERLHLMTGLDTLVSWASRWA